MRGYRTACCRGLTGSARPEHRSDITNAIDIDTVAAQVATAVGLAEGESGIRDILGAMLDAEPASIREVARLAELPVPIVAATANELRRRGVVDTQRPVRLTAAGRASVQAATGAIKLPAAGPDGTGSRVVPPALAGVAAALAVAADGAPEARAELDQTHCTVATKIGRVLQMHAARALTGQRILLIGDDDLISVAIAQVAAWAGQPSAIRRLAVVDADPAVLDWIGQQLAGTGVPAELVRHDLREPLPPALAGAFDVALTDPPYTVAGAGLFLSRAVEGLAEEPGRHVFFSFGSRRPDETLAVQRGIAEMGLVIRMLTAGFNEYLGAGILAGTSNLYHLRTTASAHPLIGGEYDGPLYSAENRAAPTRPYRCAACKTVLEVGPGSRWPRIAALQQAGCPTCGGNVFRPLPLVAR